MVISVDDLASLEETHEVVSRPKLVGQISDSLGEISSGQVEVLNKDDILASISLLIPQAYDIAWTPTSKRALQRLPEKVATAAVEFIYGPWPRSLTA